MMHQIFKHSLSTALILLGTATLALGDREHGVTLADIVSESSAIVEGKVESIKSVPLKRVAVLDEVGRASRYVEIDLNELKDLDEKAKSRLTWRHRATLSDVSTVLVNDLGTAKLTTAVIEYDTYPDTVTISYSGPVPKEGERYTFFSRSSIPKIDTNGALTFRVDLPSSVAQPGYVATLERGVDGRIKITDRTPKALDSLKYLQEKGQAWRP